MSRLRILDREECTKAIFKVILGTARVHKSFDNGRAHYVVQSATGRVIGTPHHDHRALFEAKIGTHGSGDGLFPWAHQTTFKPVSAFGGKPPEYPGNT